MTTTKNAARVAVQAAAYPNAAQNSAVNPGEGCTLVPERDEPCMQPTSAPAQAMPLPSPVEKNVPQPFDLHAIYRKRSACGYDHALHLSACEAQKLARRLRGIVVISGILIAGGDEDSWELSAYLEGGLKDALHALATDASADLEFANEKAIKRGDAA